MNTEQQNTRSNPYRVPDGYFSDLHHTLRNQISQQEETQAQGAGWHGWKGIAGFSTAFACLVLFASVGYYFTGYQAQVKEITANDHMLAYTIRAGDLEEMLLMSMEETLNTEKNELFAEAVVDYLDTYGYGVLDNGTSEEVENLLEN